MAGDKETVFRIDAVIGGHAAGFKVAAKEAARGAVQLRNDLSKLATAQAAVNKESNKSKDALAKQIVAQKTAVKETARLTRENEIAAVVERERIKVLQGLSRQGIATSVSVARMTTETRKSTRASIEARIAAERVTGALKDEGLAAVEAALGLMAKGKESKNTEQAQKELALAAWEAARAMGHEGVEARRTAIELALKGRESRSTAKDQMQLAAASAITRNRLREEREEARKLNFEFQRHRGVLASNIRSQPLFAAAVASVTAALGPLSSGLGDAAAGAIALGGGLEPLLGNLVLLPSLLGAAGQGFTVFAIGMHGVFKTLTAQGVTYQHNLEKLSKPAQEFVKTLRGPIFGTAFKELQLQIQTGLFPGLTKGLKSALGLLKPFSQVMWDTSRAIGHLGEVWGKFFGSKEFGHQFLAIGERNRQTIFRLGVAAKDMFSALSTVLVGAGPFIGHFTADIGKGAKAIDDFVTKAAKNGDLRVYFSEVEHRTKQWLHILGSSITFFHNLFEAARPLTDSIMDAWVKGAAAASDWARNSQGLKDFFISAKAPLEAMVHLIGALATGIAELAVENQKNLTQLADTLAEHVVPALQAIAEFFADLMPAISETLGVVGDSVKTILENAGDAKTVLRGVLAAIRGIAKAAAEISKHFGATGLVLVGATALGGIRLMNALLKTSIKLLRDKAFERLGIDIVGNNLALTRGKGVIGGMIPAKRGGQTVARNSARSIFSETRNAGVSAGVGGATATAVAGRAAIPVALRAAGYRVAQGTAAAVEHTPLIGALTAAALTAWKAVGQKKNVHQAAAEALTNVFTLGTVKFKDYRAIDEAGNKLMDTMQKRIAEIARRKKLSIPVDIDFKNGPVDQKTKTGELFTDFIAELQRTVKETKNKTQTWGSYFSELKTNVTLNMKRIAAETKKGSEQARQSFAANFNTAAAAVRKSMEDAGKFTKSGIAQVEKYLRQALALYGIRGRDAAAYVSTYVYRSQHPGSTGTGANEGGNPFKEAGGFVGAPGLRGRDKRHVVLGDGEAVLTHHQQGPVEHALRNTYGMGLREMFSQQQRPHYMAQGGFVAGKQWPMLSGDIDFGRALGNKLEGLAEKIGQRIYVQSGGRTLSEQAALYAKYGPGRAAAPTANAPHVRGIAADITPGQSVFGASAGQFGLGFPVPGEAWHIQITDGSDAGSRGDAGHEAGARSMLKRVLTKAKGAPGALSQAAIDTTRSAAQRLLDSMVQSGSLGDGTPGPVSGGISGKGHPAQNMAIARAMLRGHGWGGDQWAPLKSLWQGESGWDEFAVNKGSGASGIPQALGHGNVFALGDATGQIRWGLDYIKNRYGSPAAAYAAWLSRSPHWYGMGGIVGNPRLAMGAGRTPPPDVPLSQAPSTPPASSKPLRQMNPFTKKYETHTKSQWESIREKYAASRKKKNIGIKSKPPIGLKHKQKKTYPKKKVGHSKGFRDAIKGVAGLRDLPNLVSGAEFERVAQVYGDDMSDAVKRLHLDDDQQVISGLFEIANGKQVAPMATYDSSLFELRDVLNWDGGVDAGSLNFIPGIHHHVDSLNKNVGYETNIVKYLNFAVGAYNQRAEQASSYIVKYLAELNEISNLVSLWKERKGAGQKQYDSQVRRKGTWQDRVAWNQDEISALRKWLSENSDANTDSAKTYRKKAHARIIDLEDSNRHLRKDKPAPSKNAKDALHRVSIYGNDLKEMTGKGDPNEPPGDVSKWTVGGVAGTVVKTYKTLNTTLGDTLQKIRDISTDDSTGIPSHTYNMDSLRKEINEWSGSHMPAIGSSPDKLDDSDMLDQIRRQLTDKLTSLNLQDMQMGVFRQLAPYIGRFQHGGWVPQTGMAMLERGEYVVPESNGPNPIYDMKQSAAPVNVTLVLDGHSANLVRLVDARIDSRAPVVVNHIIGRKNRMMANAPGRP